MNRLLRPLATLTMLAGASSLSAQEAAAPAAAVQPVVVHATAHFDFQPHDGVACRPAVAARPGRDDEGRDMAHCLGRRLRRQRRGRRLQPAAVGPARQGGARLPTRQGLDPQMVQAQGKGTVDPVADNATAEGRAQNRRTEVTFTGVRTIASSTHR